MTERKLALFVAACLRRAELDYPDPDLLERFADGQLTQEEEVESSHLLGFCLRALTVCEGWLYDDLREHMGIEL